MIEEGVSRYDVDRGKQDEVIGIDTQGKMATSVSENSLQAENKKNECTFIICI